MYNKSAKCHLNYYQIGGALPGNMQLLCRASSGVCFMHIILSELHSCHLHDKVFLISKYTLLRIGCC